MKKTFLALAVMALSAISASAAPIIISVGIGGTLNQGINAPVTPGDSSVTFSNTTLLNTACTNLTYCSGTNVLTNLALFDSAGAANTFTWGGGTLVYTTTSVWSVTSVGSVGNRTFTILTSGNYTSNVANSDSTAGSLNFTFQEPSSAGIYTFSASGSTVPEPGSMALMGSGLVGLGLLARRRKK